MFSWYAKNTWGGQLSTINGGTGLQATIVFSPMIQEVIGEADTKDVEGKSE